MQRILVIDGDLALISLLRRGLAYEGYTVDIATTGAAGLATARDRRHDLVILDIMMPDLDGLAVLRRLRSLDTQLPVLLLIAKDAPDEQVRALESGADGFIVKPFMFEVLLAHMHALLRRQPAEQPVPLHFADLALDPRSHMVCRGQREVHLTSLEFKLLTEFLAHPRQVLPKARLLDHIWNQGVDGSKNVVEVYVKRLRQKLEGGGEPRLLHTIRGAGYILREGQGM